MIGDTPANDASYPNHEYSQVTPAVIDLDAEALSERYATEDRLRALAHLRAAASVLFELADHVEASHPALIGLLGLPQPVGVDARTIERSLGWVRAEIEDAADRLLGRVVTQPA